MITSNFLRKLQSEAELQQGKNNQKGNKEAKLTRKGNIAKHMTRKHNREANAIQNVSAGSKTNS